MKHSSPSLSTSRIERWYGKLVFAFVAIALLLIGLIVYFSFTKTTVTIVAEPREETVEFSATLSELEGVVLLTEVEGSKSKDITGSEKTETATGNAGGTVTIVNNYSQDQPLVQGTRLLSNEGILFRTQRTITVPAGGEVEVEVKADEVGEKGEIPPSRFEIVALWSGLKDRIYATSNQKMTGGLVVSNAPVVTQNDIANAQTELQESLFEIANERFAKEVEKRSELQGALHLVETPTVIELLKNEHSPEAGTAATKLTVTQKASIATVMLSQQKLIEKLRAEALNQFGVQVSDADIPTLLSNTEMSIESIDTSLTNGQLRISATIPVHLTADDKKIDRTSIINKTPEQIQEYFLTFDEVQSVSVKLSPFWAGRSPSIPESITIIIEESSAIQNTIPGPSKSEPTTTGSTNISQEEIEESAE